MRMAELIPSLKMSDDTHIITEEEANSLSRPITSDDIKNAIFDIEEDRAPGPDGFSSGFFKAAWPVVGAEVTAAVMCYYFN
ncbi:hypothetical protein Sango_3078500 [Sesamum angolense]|uniref:Uncharacterized protein n=1 Tax=Sesamum angolense TaxID=2727404 RepID=A0AAE1VZB5_9LAMI|nr:hypothetical protein Sango_3078500 [Sesamum angolense]